MRMTRSSPCAIFRRAGLTIAAALMVGLSAQADAQTTGIPAATVNGVVITQNELQARLDGFMRQRRTGAGNVFDPNYYAKMRKRVLDVLIAQELLWQQARERGYVATDEEVQADLAGQRTRYRTEGEFLAQIRESGFDEAGYAENLKQRLSVIKLIDAEIAPTVEISEQEVHGFYSENTERFVRPEEVHARHILVKVSQDADEPSRQAARERIEAIHAEAKGGADFAELAKQRSEGPSAPSGGDLGFFGRGRMVKPFEEAAFALEPGAVSDPVQTTFGYHVIKVEDRRGGEAIAEEAVAPQIRDYLKRQKTQQAVAAHAVALRETADVKLGVEP